MAVEGAVRHPSRNRKSRAESSPGLGELYLSEAARLPEGEQALAECGMWLFLRGHVKTDFMVHLEALPKTTAWIYSVCIY